MSDAISVKHTVQELTKAKAENVTLTGRLEGFEREQQKLGDLLDAAKLENVKLRRKLNGRINELNTEDPDYKNGSKQEDVLATRPGGAQQPSPTHTDTSFININDDDLADYRRLDAGSGDEEGAVARIGGARSGGADDGETDVVTLDDSVTKRDAERRTNENESWEPLFTDTTPDFLRQRGAPGSPPRLAPQHADIQRQISDLAASCQHDETTDGPDSAAIANKLTKLADEFFTYDEKYERDQRALDELRAMCQDRKNRIQELEVELLKEKYENTMLTHAARSEETQTEPGTPETPPRYRDKVASLEGKIERMTKDRDAHYEKINKLIVNGRKEQTAIQTRLDTAQQELRLQMQTNQALQTRVSELENERWRSQQEINDLRRENDQLRDDRRVTLQSLAPSMSSIRANVEQELEIARCQAETFKDDFEKEHEEKGKLAREVDELSEKLRTVVDQFDKLKYSSERKERILKRKLETTEKNNRDLTKILEEFERRAMTTVHGHAAPLIGTTPPQLTATSHVTPPQFAVNSHVTPPQFAVTSQATTPAVFSHSSRERAMAAANTRGNVQNWATGNFPLDIRARGSVATVATETQQSNVGPTEAAARTSPALSPVKRIHSAPMAESRNYGASTFNMHPIMNTEKPDPVGSLRPTAPLAVALPPVAETAPTSILEPHWPCRFCTFSNFPGVTQCEMCNQPRFARSSYQPVMRLDQAGSRSPPY